MSKDPKRSERNHEGHPATEAHSPSAGRDTLIEDMLQQKLAPMDEHRQRTDSWMKEITSQVARLAGESEGDERRAGSIDKRIADLESRIQSLLTLTEVVSLDKNPFADRGGNAPTTPPIPAPRPGTAQPPGPAHQSDPPPAANKAAEAPQPERENPDDAAPIPADDDRIRNALSPGRRQQVAEALRDAPVPAAVKPAAAPPVPSRAVHPNDASAEPVDNPFVDREPAPHAAPTPAGVHGPPARSSDDDSAPGPHINETRRRLMILQWADLLSHELPKLDLGSFLGFYVETGWVDRALAACVRNLAWQLHQTAASDQASPTHTLPELHARSILMLSHLSNEPVPSAAARRIVEDAREVMGGSPILVER